MINQYTGSEINALQLCEELKRQGHEADIGASEIGSPMSDEVVKHGIRLIDLNQVTQPLNYDVIWAHHSPVLAHVLFNTNISDCRILFSSLSSFAPLEAPPTFHHSIHLFLSLSEMNTRIMIENGVEASKVVYFPNYSPTSFYQTITNEGPPLKRIAIVSNHVPKELLEFSDLVKEKGIQVTIIGLETQPVFVTSEVLDQFDLVITIGKTVFYCFAMGKPVYVYDYFGGPGYINKNNFENNEINNYSGRGGYPQKSADELYLDITENYEKSLKETQFLQDLCLQRYDLENNLANLLKNIDNIPITNIPSFRQKHSLDKRIYAIFDYVKFTVSFDLEKTKIELSNTKSKINLLDDRNRQLEFEFQKAQDCLDICQSELQMMQAEQSRLEQDFSAQVSQYAEMEQSINFANHEIIDYYNSTSWKMTRPLRWISKKLRGGNV
jgi:signal peptidase I